MSSTPTPPASPHPRYQGRQAQALSSLNRVLAGHIRFSADGGRVVSHATRAERTKILTQTVRDLYELGYLIRDVKNLSRRHLRALMTLWEQRGYSAATLQKRCSVLRLFCRWLGKPDLLDDPRTLLADPQRFERHYAATEDHSWSAQGVDTATVIAKVAARDPLVALHLRLAQAFGLRVQEAALLRPHLAEQGEWLRVCWGTKGGRVRQVPIRTSEQRALLAEAKTYAVHPQDSTIPKDRTLPNWLNHHYYVLRCCGLTRQAGLTSHGLRHQYANDRYEELTGQPSPVRAGSGSTDTPADPASTRQGRLQVAEELGHAREQITAAYCGTPRRGGNPTDQ